jgi:hypothetical protein
MKKVHHNHSKSASLPVFQLPADLRTADVGTSKNFLKGRWQRSTGLVGKNSTDRIMGLKSLTLPTENQNPHQELHLTSLIEAYIHRQIQPFYRYMQIRRSMLR